jgi:hypothetical protein
LSVRESDETRHPDLRPKGERFDEIAETFDNSVERVGRSYSSVLDRHIRRDFRTILPLGTVNLMGYFIDLRFRPRPRRHTEVCVLAGAARASVFHREVPEQRDCLFLLSNPRSAEQGGGPWRPKV